MYYNSSIHQFIQLSSRELDLVIEIVGRTHISFAERYVDETVLEVVVILFVLQPLL